MKSVRKVLFILLAFTTSFAVAMMNCAHDLFLPITLADFPKAHDQLSDAFSDPVMRSIWEERIHHHGNIENCKYESTAGARGFALLKTGDVEGASEVFQADWLSLLGKTTISVWQNDAYTADNLCLKL